MTIFKAGHNSFKFFKKYYFDIFLGKRWNVCKNNQKHCIKLFVILLVFILQNYVLLVPFKGFSVFEIRKKLDLRKILVTPRIFLKSRFVCTNQHSNTFENFPYFICQACISWWFMCKDSNDWLFGVQFFWTIYEKAE